MNTDKLPPRQGNVEDTTKIAKHHHELFQNITLVENIILKMTNKTKKKQACV